jgi:hypothetical protein
MPDHAEPDEADVAEARDNIEALRVFRRLQLQITPGAEQPT